MTDRMTIRPDGTGTATMRSIGLDRNLTFDFEYPVGAGDMDIAHAAGLALVIEEQRMIDAGA